MNQSEAIDDLLRSGWRIYRKWRNGWVVLNRPDGDEECMFDFVTVKNTGCISAGIRTPRMGKGKRHEYKTI